MPRRIDMRDGVALVVAAGLAAGALGWFAGTAASPDSEPAASAPDPAGDLPADEPLRITMAGDSVMAGLAPAVEAALGGSGAAEVEFVLTPSILRDATVRYTWSRELEDYQPDVVVMFVGTWELGEVTNQVGTAVGPGDPSWRANYEEQVLDPWVELITADGADVVWIGAPAVESAEVDLLFAELNEAYRGLSDRFDQVIYLDSTDALAGASDGYVPIATTPQGDQVRVRQVDGLHLCPDGAVLLARALLDRLEEEYVLSESAGWETGDWRQGDEYPPESCPAP